MAISLYIEKVGPSESSELEVVVNAESKVISINKEKSCIGKCLYISGPEYRYGKYPTISIRYEMGNEGIKNREETIRAIGNMKCIKSRSEDQSIFSVVEVIRDENVNPIEFKLSKNLELYPFLDLIFPIMTRLAIANYEL